MKTFSGILIIVIIAILASLPFLNMPGVPMMAKPNIQVPMSAPLDPRPLGTSDQGVFDRIAPHILKSADERNEARLLRLAKEIEDYDPMNPPKAGASDEDKRNFFFAGTAIVMALGWLIKKIIGAVLIGVILYWLRGHVMYLVGAMLVGVFIMWMVARGACKAK